MDLLTFGLFLITLGTAILFSLLIGALLALTVVHNEVRKTTEHATKAISTIAELYTKQMEAERATNATRDNSAEVLPRRKFVGLDADRSDTESELRGVRGTDPNRCGLPDDASSVRPHNLSHLKPVEQKLVQV